MTIIDEIDKKIKKTDKGQKEKLSKLKLAKNALDTTYVVKEQIEYKIFEDLKLFDLKLKALQTKVTTIEENNRYNSNISDGLREIHN